MTGSKLRSILENLEVLKDKLAKEIIIKTAEHQAMENILDNAKTKLSLAMERVGIQQYECHDAENKALQAQSIHDKQKAYVDNIYHGYFDIQRKIVRGYVDSKRPNDDLAVRTSHAKPLRSRCIIIFMNANCIKALAEEVVIS